MTTVLIIRPAGSLLSPVHFTWNTLDVSVELVDVSPPLFGFLQGVVGGPIEMARASLGCSMYLHEEGKIVGAPANGLASELAREAGLIGDVIVGTAVVVGSPDSTGEDTSVTPAMLEHVRSFGVDIKEVQT